jgi:hypothetical protein
MVAAAAYQARGSLALPTAPPSPSGGATFPCRQSERDFPINLGNPAFDELEVLWSLVLDAYCYVTERPRPGAGVLPDGNALWE